MNETRPLTDLIKCKEIKKKLKSFLHLKLKTQNCSVKDICSRIINKNEYKFKDWYRFCKKFFFFEYKSNHVFKITRLQMFFITSEKLTFHSDEILNSTGNSFITARYE